MSMTIDRDGLQLCTECTLGAVNGDFSGLDYSYQPAQAERRMSEIVEGLEELGPNLVPDFDHDGDGHDLFSHVSCDCCGTHLAGARFRFATLAPAAE